MNKRGQMHGFLHKFSKWMTKWKCLFWGNHIHRFTFIWVSNIPFEASTQPPCILSLGIAGGMLRGRGHSIRAVLPSCTDNDRRWPSSYFDISAWIEINTIALVQLSLSPEYQTFNIFWASAQSVTKMISTTWAELFVLDHLACLLLQWVIRLMPDTVPKQGQPLSIVSKSKKHPSKEHAAHRKAQSSLRIPVKRHLERCPSKSSYCFLPLRHSAAGSWG